MANSYFFSFLLKNELNSPEIHNGKSKIFKIEEKETNKFCQAEKLLAVKVAIEKSVAGSGEIKQTTILNGKKSIDSKIPFGINRYETELPEKSKNCETFSLDFVVVINKSR